MALIAAPLVMPLLVTLGIVISTTNARACACCTNEGQRYVGITKLDTAKREELSQARFKADAQLFTGEADTGDIKGIETPASNYTMKVLQQSNRWTFEFRDEDEHSGTLILPLPASLSIFEVDPRLGERPGGHGPVLYKEWTLTAKAAGTGIFASGIGMDSRITLVLHGHGNSCTDLGHFSHWTLSVSGEKGAYKLFGELAR